MDKKFEIAPFNLARFEEAIMPLNPVLMDEYEGKDITGLQSFETPSKGILRCYKADKFEKICFHEVDYQEKFLVSVFTIWPEDNYALPVFISDWDYSIEKDWSQMFVDFWPLADCAMDKEYLKKYLDPLAPVWKKSLKELPGIGINPRSSWFKTIQSPYTIYGATPGDASLKDKATEATINFNLEYLKTYLDLWKEAEPQDPKYMKSLNMRKSAISKTFRGLDVMKQEMKGGVGEENVDLGLAVLF